MPMDLLLFSEMSLDPLFQAVQCRANISVIPVLKAHRSLFAHRNSRILRKMNKEEIRAIHQKDMNIDSYKTTTVSISDGNASSNFCYDRFTERCP